MTTTIDALTELLGQSKVSLDPQLLDERRHDTWVISHLREWRGETGERPLCVVRPQSTRDVQRLLRFATDHGTPVMPFGLGSGVCGGVLARADTILLDMSSMASVREIDEVDLLATFDAGINGLAAEQAVAAHGLTIGHWPQSIAVSSVGGWVSTRAAGQFSTAYGNIEDIVYSIEAVLPNGDLVVLGKAPRAAAGPDLRHLLMGAEGTMGVVTGVTVSLRRAAEHRAYSAYHAASMQAGFEAQRQIVQADWRPPVMRQYDAFEAGRHFAPHARAEGALLLMVHEGPTSRVEAELAATRAIATGAGLEPAPTEIGEIWLETRNHVPEWRQLFERDLIADTIEISAPWSRIGRIYDEAVAALRGVEHVLVGSAHSSHVYRSGLNLYFTFAARCEDKTAMEPTYFECWRRVMETTAAHGGGIAHHHGAGRLRKRYLELDLGESGVALLRRIRKAVDPAGIMNPGNLLPDVESRGDDGDA